MHYFRAFMIVGLMVALAGCKKENPTNGNGGNGNGYTIDNYFPLAVGNSWSFKGVQDCSDGQSDTTYLNLTVSEKYTWQDKSVFKTLSNEDPSGYMVYYDNELRVYYDPPENGGSYDIILREPLEMGTTWEDNYYTHKIASVKMQLSVPAGSFENCIKDEFTRRNVEPPVEKVKGYMAYAPGVGMVKEYVEIDYSDGSWCKALMELTSYDIK